VTVHGWICWLEVQVSAYLDRRYLEFRKAAVRTAAARAGQLSKLWIRFRVRVGEVSEELGDVVVRDHAGGADRGGAPCRSGATGPLRGAVQLDEYPGACGC
jgi:hypothetical protein